MIFFFFLSHYRKQYITLLPLRLSTQPVTPASLKGANSAAGQKLSDHLTSVFDLVVFMFIKNIFKGLKNMWTTLQSSIPVMILAG